jgi:hypothetical protein
MKQLLTIITKIDQPEYLANLVERLAYCHADMGYGTASKTGQWQPTETSTNDIYVGGTVEMIDQKEHMNIPFISSFLFTCLKGKNGIYNLEWASSLS